ncbi:HTH_Tnp_Tc3_2 domain-containing protein [Trichonephila clavipes]|nr:HTH_Tnp_Tc3_2 domain-containing protein [Trichonephila clavipes]
MVTARLHYGMPNDGGRGRLDKSENRSSYEAKRVASSRRWQKWVAKGKFQHHDGSSRLRATTDREDRLFVRPGVTAPDLSLSTIRRATRTRVFTMTIHRLTIE